jgi:hypothetical protein
MASLTLNRRHVVAGLGALCLAPCCAPAAHAAKIQATVIEDLSARGGCSLATGDLGAIEAALGKGGVDYGDGFVPTSGDANLDRELGKALVRLSQLFGERPGFGFYDDTKAQNAFASPESRLPGTWGTVLFGKTLFWDLFRGKQDGGMSVLAVLAHEFGHIVQVHRGLRQQLLAGQTTVKRNELHADFLSGFYLGSRKREFPNLPMWAAGETFHQIGDTNYAAAQHHGTPAERVAAAERGFAIGMAGGGIDQAVREGLAFVLRG